MPIHLKQFWTAWSSLRVVQTGLRELPEFVAKIVAIRILGPSRAKFSIFVRPATKNGPYSMLNTWPRICSLIYRIVNLFLRFPRFSDHTLNRISDCLARCPGWYSPCFLIFSPWQPVKNYYVPVLSAISRLVNSLDSTRTGMFWFWKVGSPSTTALYIYQSEPTKGCSRSGKQRLWLCFCERN